MERHRRQPAHGTSQLRRHRPRRPRIAPLDELLRNLFRTARLPDREENIRRNLCILRWLRQELHWTLLAIIHTGGKSCHGWFDGPPPEHVRELKPIAPALGIDASVFNPAHRVRLPGVSHEKTGALSRLLFLSPD